MSLWVSVRSSTLAVFLVNALRTTSNKPSRLTSILFLQIFFCALAAAASLPLGELFFFHVLLWRKKLTTYDYVLVMRDVKAREEAAAQEREERRQLAQADERNGAFCAGCCPDVAAIARDVVSASAFVRSHRDSSRKSVPEVCKPVR